MMRQTCCGLLFLLLAACQTTGGQVPSVSDTRNGSPTDVTYNWFHTPADHVLALLAEGRTETAAEVYSAERSYFDENAVKAGSGASVAKSDLLAAVREETAALMAMNFGDEDLSNDVRWPEISSYLTASDALTERERRLDTLGAEDDDHLDRLTAEWDGLMAKLWSGAPEALLDTIEAGAGADFFVRYPVDLNRAETISAAQRELMESGARFAALSSFAKLYFSDIGDQDRSTFARALWSASCAAGGSLDGTRALCQLRQVADAGLLAQPEISAQSPVRINDVTDPDVSVDWGAFTPVVSGDAGPAEGVSPVVVVFAATPLGLAIDKSELANQIVSSSFIAGSETVPSPEYEAQKALVEQLQTSYASAQAQSTISAYQSQSCYGAACTAAAIGSIGTTFGAILIQDELNDAIWELENMSPTVTETLYADYDIDMTRVAFEKRTGLRLLVFDRTREEFDAFVHAARDTYTVDIHVGVHPEDPLYEDFVAPSEESDRFLEQPLVVNGDRVLRQIVTGELAMAERHKGGLEKARALAEARPAPSSSPAVDPSKTAISAGTPLATSPLLRSVVLIETPLGTGAGFFVSETEVLTNNHVIEGEKFADIYSADGAESFGKVIKRSVIKDLALIKVNTPGIPAVLHSGFIEAGAEVFAAGHPKGFDFSLSRGIVSGMRNMPVGGDGAPDVRLIQTDAAINTGNSGGPLFLSGKVIGVNTQFFSKDEAEGISFVVHIDEVRDFLAQPPGS